jgi:hypothetical protein
VRVRVLRGIAYDSGYQAVDAQGSYTFTGLLAGSYLAQANDDSPSACAASQQIAVGEFARIGCRDPAASNYDPEATQDGSCEYTPGLAA